MWMELQGNQIWKQDITGTMTSCSRCTKLHWEIYNEQSCQRPICNLYTQYFALQNISSFFRRNFFDKSRQTVLVDNMRHRILEWISTNFYCSKRSEPENNNNNNNSREIPRGGLKSDQGQVNTIENVSTWIFLRIFRRPTFKKILKFNTLCRSGTQICVMRAHYTPEDCFVWPRVYMVSHDYINRTLDNLPN